MSGADLQQAVARQGRELSHDPVRKTNVNEEIADAIVGLDAIDQATVDQEFDDKDILTNCRVYPKDEAPAAYKDFNEVLESVKQAGLASEVARLKARFVIKDASKADD